MCWARTRTHTIYLENFGVDAKASAKCGQIHLPQNWCREAGRRTPTTSFQCMLGCIERESWNCLRDQNWEENRGCPFLVGGLRRSRQKPLYVGGWDTRFWCQKDSGASGVSQVLFSVFRKWSGAFSKQTGGLKTATRTIFFENQACLLNIFMVVVAYQMSCVTMRWCQILFLSGKVTHWNTNWTETNHSLIDKFFTPNSYGRERHSLQNNLDANVSRGQTTPPTSQ